MPIDDNCLNPNYTNCTIYSGISSKVLGVDAGDSLDFVLGKIIGWIESADGVGDSCASCKKSGLVGFLENLNDKQPNIDNLDYSRELLIGGMSVDASKLSGISFDYGVGNEQGQVDTFVDIAETKKSLPAGYVAQGSKIEIVSSKDSGSKLLLKSTGDQTGSKIDQRNFPLTANVSLNVKAPSGEVIELTRTMSLKLEDSTSAKAGLDVKTRAATADSTFKVADVLQNMDAVVAALRKDVDNLKR